MMRSQQATQYLDKSNLRKLLTTHFTIEDLEVICFDLRIEFEDLKGSTRSAKARSLIDYCCEHQRIYDLLTYCREERKNVNWPAEANCPPSVIDDDKSSRNTFFPRTIALLIDLAFVNLPLFIASLAIVQLTDITTWREGIFTSSQAQMLNGVIQASDLVLLFIVVAWYWFYFAVSESSAHQATLGKRLLGLMVTDLNGDQITLSKATLRLAVKFLFPMITTPLRAIFTTMLFFGGVPNIIYVGACISGIALVVNIVGLILAQLTPNHQALHDLIARTLVMTSKNSFHRVQ